MIPFLIYILCFVVFYTVLPLAFKLSCGKSVKYRYIEFFAFDYDSLPISFQSGDCCFPLVALDKILWSVVSSLSSS